MSRLFYKSWVLLCLFGTTHSAFAALSWQDVLALMKGMVQNHYSKNVLDEKVGKDAIDSYIRSLDPNKSLLYEEEIPELRDHLMEVPRSGWVNFSPIRSTQAYVAQRAEAALKFAENLLASTHSIDENARMQLNSDKALYPKVSEWASLVRNQIHFILEDEVSRGASLEEAKKEVLRQFKERAKVMKENANESYREIFLEAFAQSLDPHTAYLRPQAATSFEAALTLTVEGIGVLMDADPLGFKITKVLKNSSAQKAGLKEGDIILALRKDDGTHKEMKAVSFEEAISLIRGKAGTHVNLTLKRDGLLEPVNVDVTRAKVDIETGHASIQYHDKTIEGKPYRIGVIQVPGFYASEEGVSVANDVEKLLKEAKTKNVDGIVVDLSMNGGGYLKEGVALTNLFIQDVPVVAEKGNGVWNVLRTPKNETAFDGPLVVVTSPFSASAAELFAGALKDHGRAVIVGDKTTYGKGSMQYMADLGDYGMLKITDALFFRPNGKSTQFLGVESDIVFPPYVHDSANVGEKHAPNAIEPHPIAPLFEKVGVPLVNANLLSTLSELSTKRVEEDPVFQELRTRSLQSPIDEKPITIAELRERKNQNKKNSIGTGTNEPHVYQQEATRIAADWAHQNCLRSFAKAASEPKSASIGVQSLDGDF